MKKLLLFLCIAFASCEVFDGKCWKCEIKYLDLKTQKLLMPVDTLKLCGKTRSEVKPLEFNGQYTHEKLGVVRKIEYCEEN